MRDPTWCREQAREIGKHCSDVIEILFNDQVLDRLRAAQGILKLQKTYGSVRLEAACARAIAFNSVRYKTIKGILKNGLEYDYMPNAEAYDVLGRAYTNGQFIRSEKSSVKILH